MPSSTTSSSARAERVAASGALEGGCRVADGAREVVEPGGRLLDHGAGDAGRGIRRLDLGAEQGDALSRERIEGPQPILCRFECVRRRARGVDVVAEVGGLQPLDPRLVLLELLLQHLALAVALMLAASVLVEGPAQADDLVGEQAGPRVAHDGRDRRRLARHLGLAAERLQLAPDLAREVGQAGQVRLHGVELAEGLLLAAAVLQDPRGLLDEAAPVLGARVQHGVELPLADDHVHLPAEARVAQQLLHVEQPARLAVDGVLARAVAEQRAGDRHLAVLDRQRAVGVVDREADLGTAERTARGGAREDDVLHLAAAQRLGTLLPHDPGERVHDVRLAGAVGADDARDARFEGERRRLREGLESLQRQALEVHVPPFRLASALPTSVVEERRAAVRPRRHRGDPPLPHRDGAALIWAAARAQREERS